MGAKSIEVSSTSVTKCKWMLSPALNKPVKADFCFFLRDEDESGQPRKVAKLVEALAL